MLSRRLAHFLAVALFLSTAWLPLEAAAVPDFSAELVVVQPDGAFTAIKRARVYLEGNPDDPFPGDGNNTYIYTIENVATSFFPIIRFAIEVPPLAVTGAGNQGAGVVSDPPGGAVVGNEVEWNYFSTPIQPGEITNEMYILSTFTPGGTSDNLVSINGEFGFDAPSACIGPMIPAEACELEVEKFCFVEPPPSTSGDDCQGKAKRLVFEYTGEECDAGANDQLGVAYCNGNPAGQQPVSAFVFENASQVSVIPAGQTLNVGSLVNFSATGSYLPSPLKVKIKKNSTILQTLEIDASCGTPINVGDEFGALKLVEIKSTQGGTVSTPDPDPAPTDVCKVEGFPPGTPCDDPPSVLELRYVGGSCADTTNNQFGTVECAGAAGMNEPVRITVSQNADGSGYVYLDTIAATVNLGDVVEAYAENAGQNVFTSSIYIRIRNAADVSLQLLKIRVDCNKPLAIGNRFGAIQVMGLDNMSLGDNVAYTYVVTNPNSGTATNVNVIDNPLGIVTVGETIAGNSSETYTKDEFITTNTMNTVTVTGEVNGVECDEAMDGATVVVKPQHVMSKKKKHKSKKKVSKHKGHKAKKKQHHHKPGCGHHGW
jgi:hypothetical protein